MKFKILFLMLTFLTLSSGLAGEKKNNDIIIAADLWCPYNCEPASSAPGYMVEIVIESFRLLGSGEKVIYKKLPWTRAIKDAKNGKIQGIIGAVATESKGLHMPKSELGQTTAHYFTNSKNNYEYKSLASIKNNRHRIGLIQDYGYSKEVDRFFKSNPKRVYYAFGEDALPILIKRLQKNNLHAIIEDQYVFWYKVKLMGLKKKNFKSIGTIVKGTKLYTSFNNKKHAEIVSKGVDLLRESGRLKKILAKYNLRDWK
jgi:polar amino acid transport system substrate-binding protein